VFGKKRSDRPESEERPHPYKPGYGHARYCLALLPTGLHCGRKEVDPIHIVDERNPLRRRG
jgi:hypothetical protein